MYRKTMMLYSVCLSNKDCMLRVFQIINNLTLLLISSVPLINHFSLAFKYESCIVKVFISKNNRLGTIISSFFFEITDSIINQLQWKTSILIFLFNIKYCHVKFCSNRITLISNGNFRATKENFEFNKNLC